MSEYGPGRRLRIVGQLPAPITVRLLRLPNDETVSVISRPDEYTGYVARAELDARQVTATTFLFTRETLVPGLDYDLSSDAQVFSERLRLFQTTVRVSERNEESGGFVSSE